MVLVMKSVCGLVFTQPVHGAVRNVAEIQTQIGCLNSERNQELVSSHEEIAYVEK